jgi:hypothetical protein
MIRGNMFLYQTASCFWATQVGEKDGHLSLLTRNADDERSRPMDRAIVPNLGTREVMGAYGAGCCPCSWCVKMVMAILIHLVEAYPRTYVPKRLRKTPECTKALCGAATVFGRWISDSLISSMIAKVVSRWWTDQCWHSSSGGTTSRYASTGGDAPSITFDDGLRNKRDKTSIRPWNDSYDMRFTCVLNIVLQKAPQPTQPSVTRTLLNLLAPALHASDELGELVVPCANSFRAVDGGWENFIK